MAIGYRRMTEPIKPRTAAQRLREMQAAFLAEGRAQSVLDPQIRLGVPPWPPKPEIGETVAAYYAKKHGPRGPGRGRFWPLHVVQTAPHWQTKQ